MVSDLIPFI